MPLKTTFSAFSLAQIFISILSCLLLGGKNFTLIQFLLEEFGYSAISQLVRKHLMLSQNTINVLVRHILILVFAFISYIINTVCT